jgi:polyisoprenyl-phosphate glycosyltransferase
MPVISLIIPVHNEQDNLEWHHGVIAEYFNKRELTYEIVYVDDGSQDNSLEIIKSLHKAHPEHIRYIALSRNFGKEAAVSAGIHSSKGKATVIIDADGQHPIELLDIFVDEWHKGYDVVIGRREANKGEGAVKKYGSKLFYFMLRLISGKSSTLPGSTDFRLIDQKVVAEYNKLTERNRLARNLIDWLGFKQSIVPFSANERHAGKASYSFRKLTKLALDGVVAHSTRPLKFISLLGFLISTVSVIAATFLVVESYILDDPLHLGVTGVAILALFLSFLIGIVLVCQGLLALYLESVYYETQNRPLYVIREEG